MGVEGSRIGQVRVIPKVINALISRHDLTRSLHEELHEFELLAG